MEIDNHESTPAVGDATAAPVSDVKETAPAASTESTADTGQKTPASTLDAVMSALKPKAPDEGSPASQTQDSKTVDPAAAKAEDQLPEEVTEDELKDQKPKTRKRIEQLLGKVKNVSAERDTLAPKAAEFDKMVNFIARNKLTKEDVDTTFELAALVRGNDPAKALERLEPIYQQLKQLAGDVLPTDLQERIRLGYISEKDARELHRSKTAASLATARATETAQEAETRQVEERRQGIIRDVSSAMTEWESGKKSSDPDWHMKSDRINQLIKLDVYENGYPTTKADAVKRIEKVYDDVTKEVRKFIPKPTAKQQNTPGGSSSQTVAEPKTFLDAVRIGLGR